MERLVDAIGKCVQDYRNGYANAEMTTQRLKGVEFTRKALEDGFDMVLPCFDIRECGHDLSKIV